MWLQRNKKMRVENSSTVTCPSSRYPQLSTADFIRKCLLIIYPNFGVFVLPIQTKHSTTRDVILGSNSLPINQQYLIQTPTQLLNHPHPHPHLFKHPPTYSTIHMPHPPNLCCLVIAIRLI